MIAKRLFSALFAVFLALPSWATDLDAVPQTWQLLDYLATDYAAAVDNGTVINDAEYLEMQQFSATIAEFIQALPEHDGKTQLVMDAQQLVQMVNATAGNAEVNQQAHDLANELLRIYPIPTAPSQTPNLAQGSKLYQQHCAACHGVTGAADGPQAVNLDPPVIAFTDLERANQRSPLSLFQTTSQGLEGTAMVSYAQTLTTEQRWAIAYYAGTLAYLDGVTAGGKLWQASALARAQVSNLQELSSLRVEQLSAILGQSEAEQLIGYLRAHPEELDDALTGIALARGRLQASFAAYQKGDSKNAVQLALSSYLDGVEPVEAVLNINNKKLRVDIELAMGHYRTSLSKGLPIDDIGAQVSAIDQLLVEAQTLTHESNYSASTVFLGAFTILVREGLEALLIVIAIIAFLNKAGRREALMQVHAGWISALIVGALTWLAARYLIDISGAGRELTEGFSALFAVVVLLSVGLWMHQKSVGDRWQVYLREKMHHAMSKKSAWFLFVLVFISVYREVFETILFYAALWVDGLGGWLVAGMAAAILVLALITWLMLQGSKRLPISTFFAASSGLIALIAFVLTGKGIANLQEAGLVSVSLAPLPSIDWLGMFPTWESATAQAIVLLLLIAGYFYNKRPQAADATV